MLWFRDLKMYNNIVLRQDLTLVFGFGFMLQLFILMFIEFLNYEKLKEQISIMKC